MRRLRVLSAFMLACLVFIGGILEVHAEYLLTTLEQSHMIEVKQSWFSLNKSYKVYVDGNKVGKVEGLYFNLFGERLVLSDLNGDVYGSEQQIKRWNIRLNRLAQVYNSSNETVGFIGEEVIEDFFRWGKTFHFYDENRKEDVYKRQVDKYRLVFLLHIENREGWHIFEEVVLKGRNCPLLYIASFDAYSHLFAQS